MEYDTVQVPFGGFQSVAESSLGATDNCCGVAEDCSETKGNHPALPETGLEST